MSEAGYLGARGGGVDLMVAMNPQTWTQDIASIVPGGYLFYDNTKPMPPSRFRDDIVIIGVPLTEITNKAYTESRQRQLFKNIVYLGALSALLQMDVAEIESCWASSSAAATSWWRRTCRRCTWAATGRSPTWNARSG